jgi:thiamine biosynthesis lipoprotein
MATSSTLHRRWSRGGLEVHHILDPRTGQPADECIVSATVCAASCVAANAASTAAVILGSAAGAWLTARRLPALLVDRHGRPTEYAGWASHLNVGASW